MPLSCANALRPTIALLYCTGNEVAADTSFEARVSMVVSILFHHGNTSLRTFIAITTSSSAALPARSPMPLTVHSICRRSEEHTSELQSPDTISYAVFCL